VTSSGTTVERVLRAVDGNRRRRRDLLGIDRSTLYRKLASKVHQMMQISTRSLKTEKSIF